MCFVFCDARHKSEVHRVFCILLDTEKNCVLHLLDNVFCICLTRRIIVFCILLCTEKNCVLHLLDTEKKLGGARSAEAGSTVSGVLQSCRQQQSEIIS